MEVPFMYEYIIERTLATQPTEEQRLLNRLAGTRLTPAEGRAEWPKVLEHKWFISERLGRDIGLRAAAIDYFENVRLPRPTRARKETFAQRLRRVLQPLSVNA